MTPNTSWIADAIKELLVDGFYAGATMVCDAQTASDRSRPDLGREGRKLLAICQSLETSLIDDMADVASSAGNGSFYINPPLRHTH